MNAQQASRTALVTALMRSLHTRSAAAPLLHDPWGDVLVPAAVRAVLHERTLARLAGPALDAARAQPADRVVDAALRGSAAFADVVLRSRYAEDQLQAAVARGTRQYVLVGAGFDSFICRQPDWAADLAVYEVDHPATQGLKRERLRACQVPLPAAVHFVAADLAQESLGAALQRSAFQPAQATFFSWLGVTMYLSRAANLAALRAMAACAPAGGDLVFSYVDEALLRADHPAAEDFRQMQRTVASMGEAFQCGFDPQEMPALLQEAGLQLLEDLSGTQLLARYDPQGRSGLAAAGAARLVHARIPRA
ncbi:class I SAM-dependent methyltransferase [Aquabacterium sp.]|uniref:class I SAM-dependent methyltransferase n=1 Tax=Aquabacterium sp. TaxID=1872578 RepID=UPI003785111A